MGSLRPSAPDHDLGHLDDAATTMARLRDGWMSNYRSRIDKAWSLGRLMARHGGTNLPQRR